MLTHISLEKSVPGSGQLRFESLKLLMKLGEVWMLLVDMDPAIIEGGEKLAHMVAVLVSVQ